jgi:hypothetical protein
MVLTPIRGRLRQMLLTMAALAALLTIAVFSTANRGSAGGPAAQPNEQVRASPQPPTSLSDQVLTVAADELLAAVHPAHPENDYFPSFARTRLRWMLDEHSDGRLQVALYDDRSERQLPAGILMAASRTAEMSTIFIGKPRFTQFLLEAGSTRAPFTEQQKNDFALALVHEVLHLQSSADPRDAHGRLMEESRVWRDVSVHAVRPLRALERPLHRRFLEVDDALQRCRDALPCPPLAGLVRSGL